MARVSVNSGEVTAALLARDVPVAKWPELIEKRQWHCQVTLTADCREVALFVKEAEEMWSALGYQSADDLIASGYGLEPDEIRLVAAWLELNDPDEAVPLQKVKDAVRQARENPLRSEVGRPAGENDSNGIISRGGNNQEYTLRRLARDNPALLDKVESGELSANAAAIQAGFRRPTKTIPIDTPASAVRALLRVFSAEEIINAAQQETA